MFELDQIGLMWFKMDLIGSNRSNWFKIDQIGSNWTKMDKIGLKLIQIDQTILSLRGILSCCKSTLLSDAFSLVRLKLMAI